MEFFSLPNPSCPGQTLENWHLTAYVHYTPVAVSTAIRRDDVPSVPKVPTVPDVRNECPQAL